jgi:nucleotide-binding universal stress UspA family protein
MILTVCYAAGLRISEAVRLTPAAIDRSGTPATAGGAATRRRRFDDLGSPDPGYPLYWPHDASSADIIRHLARYGISAETARTVMVSISASDVLLSYASDISADLLVVGGYGHSPARARTRRRHP